MWIVVINVMGMVGEGFTLTSTSNKCWLEELVAKLLECTLISEVKIYKEAEE